MNSGEISEVLLKLIGGVHPVQETNYDNVAYNNQETLLEVMDACFDEVIDNAQRTDDYAYSVKRIKDRAINYLGSISEYCANILDDLTAPDDMTHLRVCPCCHGKAHYHIHDRIGIECEDCGLGLACIYETKEQAAAVWNRRNA